jgi:hypothetical protein
MMAAAVQQLLHLLLVLGEALLEAGTAELIPSEGTFHHQAGMLSIVMHAV